MLVRCWLLVQPSELASARCQAQLVEKMKITLAHLLRNAGQIRSEVDGKQKQEWQEHLWYTYTRMRCMGVWYRLVGRP